MIDRVEATTRERDFADVVLLTRRHPIAAPELLAALRATANHRQSILRPLEPPPVRLRAYKPLVSVRRAIDSSQAIDEDERAWLKERCAQVPGAGCIEDSRRSLPEREAWLMRAVCSGS